MLTVKKVDSIVNKVYTVRKEKKIDSDRFETDLMQYLKAVLSVGRCIGVNSVNYSKTELETGDFSPLLHRTYLANRYASIASSSNKRHTFQFLGLGAWYVLVPVLIKVFEPRWFSGSLTFDVIMLGFAALFFGVALRESTWYSAWRIDRKHRQALVDLLYQLNKTQTFDKSLHL